MLIVSVVVCVVAVFVLFDFSRDGYYSGDHVTYPVSSEVSEELKPYVDLTLTGMRGDSFMRHESGQVSWVGQPQDSVESVENIRLMMYSRVNSTTTSGDSTWTVIEIRVVAYTENFTLPSDAIGQSEELMIPQLGINNPQHEFELSCRVS